MTGCPWRETGSRSWEYWTTKQCTHSSYILNQNTVKLTNCHATTSQSTSRLIWFIITFTPSKITYKISRQSVRRFTHSHAVVCKIDNLKIASVSSHIMSRDVLNNISYTYKICKINTVHSPWNALDTSITWHGLLCHTFYYNRRLSSISRNTARGTKERTTPIAHRINVSCRITWLIAFFTVHTLPSSEILTKNCWSIGGARDHHVRIHRLSTSKSILWWRQVPLTWVVFHWIVCLFFA